METGCWSQGGRELQVQTAGCVDYQCAHWGFHQCWAETVRQGRKSSVAEGRWPGDNERTSRVKGCYRWWHTFQLSWALKRKRAKLVNGYREKVIFEETVRKSVSPGDSLPGFIRAERRWDIKEIEDRGLCWWQTEDPKETRKPGTAHANSHCNG